ncbi:serine-rich adhesin for platelets isoform X13 [Drosophila persimilis]|uniref:serine-rich adhesin for platelets isoform X13 n=1 Tax=Drosophila persimilis TaxID=7234 RepID=UPI000F085930|nr:serine-rich adhesin for platelets isoform X13 [Drosophila persimilis]
MYGRVETKAEKTLKIVCFVKPLRGIELKLRRDGGLNYCGGREGSCCVRVCASNANAAKSLLLPLSNSMSPPHCCKRLIRPYIRLMQLPIYRPAAANLLLGLTSVVGLVGGAYLLQCGAQRLLGKIADRKWKKEEAREQQSCNVCCADLDQSSPKTYVTCCTCGKCVCRGPKCADWRPKDADWECQLCHSSKESLAHTSSWVAEQMSFNQHKFVYPMRARSEVYIPITGDGDGDANDSTMHIESISQIGQSVHLDERAKIRAYVEEIVAEMLGGSLDHIKVGQLSKSENYLQFFHKFHAKLSNLLINVESDLLKGDLPAIVNGSNSNNNNNNNNGDSESLADISQTRLRSLIETIIAETLRNSALSVSGAVSEISLDTRSLAAELPNKGNGLKRRHRTEHYFEPKIYQDLLATAVLNKIADKEGNTRLISESTPDLSGHLIDENYNAEALSTTSGSSIEPRSDCSLTDHELALDTGKSKSLQADLERESVLSDYIAAHMVPLPDFSASVTESEDDVGSISSSMIGDGTWEDNWLFKKKRSSVQSSVTPSSIGMLVPAPMENVRAQIGDRTADEVSDLSELGSDVEDNSLDLLRCNDLNDRLLSKHLIGGQNTKLVLDELVDRTSLISHTLPEEHEPAFTETTNTFVVASSAATSDVIVSLPSPMVFQDDSMNEELVQTPIAAQGETDELASLEGCIGYSTVEYIDEEQMRETTPSVIEILAAIALGPMLAVPASEQPGVITPSEMHTLKELSDLALAEINARTMDLAHHSLDIIEEENIELMPFTGSVSEPSTINVHPSTLTDPTTNHQSTETTAAQEPKMVPKPAIDSDAPIHNPSTTQILTVDKPAALDPPAAVEISPETDTVAVDPPPPAAAEIISDTETVAVDPPAALDISPAAETVAVDPPAAVELITDPETVAVDPPAAALEIIPDAETVAVDPSAPVEILPETQTVAVDHAPPAALEITPAAETVAVDPPAAVEIISETETVAVYPPPPAAVEITPAAETVAVDPAAAVAIITEPETVDADPPAAALEIIPETETVAVDPAPPAAVEITPAAETVAVDPPAAVEIITEPETVAVDPTAAALEIIPDAETVAVDPSAPVEIIPETETVAVDPAPPAAVEITLAAETVAVDSLAAVEIITEPETVAVEPPAAALEIIPETETVAVDPPAPVEIIPETETVAVDPAPPAAETVSVDPPSAAEIIPETEIVAVDPPAAALEIIPDAETVAVDPSAPVEILPETQTVAVDHAPPAALEITPAAETVAVDPSAAAEIIPETEIVAVDPPAALEIITEPETVAVDPPAAVEIMSETTTIAVDPAAAVEDVENVSLDPPAAVGIIPETETVAVDPSPPAVVEIIAGTESVVLDPTGAVEFIPETQTKAVEIPAVEVEAKSVSDLGPNALIDDTQLLNCVPKPLKESDNMDTALLEPSSECVPAQTSVEYTKSDSSALGSIAEREVKKWYNAVEMPNNPYAPEALKQRISGTQERYMDVPNISPSAEQKALAAALTEDGDPAPPSTDYKRYSRDYYINNAPNGTEVNGIVRRASSGAEKQPSAEDVEQDIVITEAAQNASTTAIEQDKEQESVAANVYTALPAQVFDDLLETQSNPSLHSLQTTTTTSDESETVRVYDFNKQETTVIRPAPAEQQPSSSTTSSMESAQSASVSSSSIDASVSKKRERPVVLQFGPADSVPTIGSPVNTPTRGSTPPAFRFLQPKRRLIEPSQVLSVDEDDVMEPNTPVAEKPAVEDEVVHAMPSVKALAQAFLLTSKAQQAERRWRSKVRLSLPADTSDKSPTSLARRHKLEHAVSMAEVADESTIASDLSSLETDPSIQSDGSTNPPIASPVTPVPVRHGFLRSNIAFFENLKFK